MVCAMRVCRRHRSNQSSPAEKVDGKRVINFVLKAQSTSVRKLNRSVSEPT